MDISWYVAKHWLLMEMNVPLLFCLRNLPICSKNLLPKEQGEVVIEFDERNAVFMLESYRMVCRLIEGRYPNYNSVIPQNNPHKVTVDRPATDRSLAPCLYLLVSIEQLDQAPHSGEPDCGFGTRYRLFDFGRGNTSVPVCRSEHEHPALSRPS